MNFASKYEMGQLLYSIQRASVDSPPTPCHACEDGTVELRGERFECPKCKGKKQLQAHASGWVITGSGRVGKIGIEHCSPYYDKAWGDEEVEGRGTPFSFVTYMLDSTGVGSGTVYEEPNLLSSREKAQAECDRRNGFARSADAQKGTTR